MQQGESCQLPLDSAANKGMGSWSCQGQLAAAGIMLTGGVETA